MQSKVGLMNRGSKILLIAMDLKKVSLILCLRNKKNRIALSYSMQSSMLNSYNKCFLLIYYYV